MSRTLLKALMLLPAIGCAGGVESADLCDALRAKVAGLPEIIGAGRPVQYKAESMFRLNRIEIAIKRDMRRLQCPSASIIYYGAENESDCQHLGEELADIGMRKQELADLQPVLTQTVDDGLGTLNAVVRRMKQAGCDLKGTQNDVEIIGNATGGMPVQAVAARGRQSASEAAEPDVGDMSALLGNDDGRDFGTPDNYGLVEVNPAETPETGDGRMAVVELPKLEGQDLLPAPGPAVRPAVPESTPQAAQAAPEAPVRDYNPDDRTIRRVGPSFLAEKESGINLPHPAQAGVN